MGMRENTEKHICMKQSSKSRSCILLTLCFNWNLRLKRKKETQEEEGGKESNRGLIVGGL